MVPPAETRIGAASRRRLPASAGIAGRDRRVRFVVLGEQRGRQRVVVVAQVGDILRLFFLAPVRARHGIGGFHLRDHLEKAREFRVVLLPLVDEVFLDPCREYAQIDIEDTFQEAAHVGGKAARERRIAGDEHHVGIGRLRREASRRPVPHRTRVIRVGEGADTNSSS